MAKTVVGVFRDAVGAQKVQQELLREGYMASDIRVLAHESTGYATSTSHERGLGAGLDNFIRSFTGAHRGEHLETESAQAAAVVSVVVPDGQEADVMALLDKFGGEDIELDSNAALTANGHATDSASSGGIRGTAELPTRAALAPFKEAMIEFTETAEELVISKTARVVEEIVIGRHVSERTQIVRETLRHTEVEIEQLGAKTTSAGIGNKRILPVQ